MVKLKIDNYEVEATAGTSILEAARSVHIEIPTLCKHRHALHLCLHREDKRQK